MIYNGYLFLGMDLIWWCVWILLIFWIFATPYDIPFSRHRKDYSFDILRKRFASGEITTVEYLESKKLLAEDLTL